MANETQDSLGSSQSNYLEAIFDPFDGSSKLLSTISSANFNGAIPDLFIEYPSATVSDLIPGRFFLSGDTYYLITRIDENIDPVTTDTVSYNVWYSSDGVERNKTILVGSNTFTDNTELSIKKDDWVNKSVGDSGWTITTEGNSIFSNVAVRGRIEATEGYFDGFLVVGDPENTQTPGSMKIGTGINNVSLSVSADNSDTTLSVSSSTGVFVGMFVLGTGIPPNTRVTNVSSTIITISNATTQALSNASISFINNGLHINTNNYWYDTGLFSIGNGTAGVVWNGSTLAITGQVTATSGTIGGFTIGATSLTAGTESNSVGLAPGTFPFFAGSATPSSAPFRVNTAGQLTATGATITGAITATSGTFTGTVNATGGTFTNVVNIGSGTNKIKLTGGTTDLSTSIEIGSGGFGVAPFYAEGTGKFSLGTGLSWNPATSILNVNGILKGFVAVEAVPVVVNPNSMNFGYFSAVEDIHGTGVGLKIDNNNYWFSNNQFRVGTSGSYFSWDGTTLEASGTIKADSGNIGGEFGWQIEGSKIYSGSNKTYISLQSSGDFNLATISKIVIDDEGDGKSSIFILSQIPEGYTSETVTQLENTSISFPEDSGLDLVINETNKLTSFSYPIRNVYLTDWSLVSGTIVEGGAVTEGYVTFVIFGEDNGQAFQDETVSGLNEEIQIGQAGSGIYIGSEIATDAPFSINQSGILKASSGIIGGFEFEQITDEGFGGSFSSASNAVFNRGIYSLPYSIELSPTNGIILTANSSLNDATSYFIEGSDTPYPVDPDAPAKYRDVLRATGFTIIDNTGAASNVTINPYMGFRSESVSALNIAKNGSFEYKAGASTSYSYSGAGWVSETGLTLSSLSATTAGYSFPVLPYGQQFVGKLSWTTAVSTFLKTTFLIDSDGSNENYPSPLDSTTYLSAGYNGLATSFAVYNSEASGLFGTNHYVAAYPLEDIKVTYTDDLGATKTINPFTNTDIKISDMLQGLEDAASSFVNLPNGYLYLSAPYQTNRVYSVSARTYDAINSTTTLTIGSHSFYVGQEVLLQVSGVDITEGFTTFTVSSVTSTQIVVDDATDPNDEPYSTVSVNQVNSGDTLVYSSSATRGKNGLEFIIDPSDYSDANQALPFTLHLPGYYYGVTFDATLSQNVTMVRAYGDPLPTTALTISNGVTIFLPENNETIVADTSTLDLDDISMVFLGEITETGIYDLYFDYDNQFTYPADYYSAAATSIVVLGDQVSFFPVNSFAKIKDSFGEDTGEYIKITARSYNSTDDITTLTVSRGQQSSVAVEIAPDYLIYTVERINITNISNVTANYFNLDKALFDDVSGTVTSTMGAKIANSSIAFDELVISDSSISYFDGDTGGGAFWGIDASQPGTWSYRPSAVIAQLGGNPLVIGNSPGLQLIKQISYEPYTYLLENPSVTVQQWDSDLSQSSLVISGGKFSTSSIEPRIELVSGTSATNSGRINIDSKSLYITGATSIAGATSIVGATSITGNASISGTLSSGALTAPSLTATGRIKGTPNYREAFYTGARGASATYLAAATASLTNVSANSSVLLMVTGSFNPSTATTYVNVYVDRGSSRVTPVATVQTAGANNNQPIALAFIDPSPATGPQSYTVKMRALNGTADWGADTGNLRLTALELF